MKDANAYQEAIEKLKEEKRLTEKLLGISEALVNASQRDQLFHIIVEKIGKLLPMDDLAIVIVNEDKTQWKDISISRGLNQKKITQELTEGGFDVWLGMNSLIERFLSSTEIMTIEHYRKFKDFPSKFTQIMEEDGLKEFIHTPLRMADKVFGALVFDTRKSGTYAERHFSLFQAIADQLAVAVSNVLAQEELLKRQKRIEDLLKISTAASNIQSRSELLKVIFETIKPVFPFDTAGLFIIDQKNDEHYEILDNIDILGQHDATQVEIINSNLLGRFKHKGSGIEYVSRKGGPHLFDLKKDAKKWPHPQINIMLDNGLRQLIGIGLKSGSETFGMLCFSSKKEDFYSEKNFSFFKAISEQVALAVSNVLANEQLLEEKRFKETLLGISEAVATIKNRRELFDIIFERINKVIPVDDVAIVIFNEDRTLWRDLSVSPDFSGTHFNTRLNKFGYDKWHAMDSLTKKMMDKTGILTDEDYFKHEDFAFVEILKETGLKEFMYTPLKTGNNIFGFLVLDAKKRRTYSKIDFPLFQAIADQLAVAVSNVLANEQLLEEKQLTEKLLGISEALVNVSQRDQLFHVIVEKIGKLLPMDDLAVVIVNEDKSEWKDISLERAFGKVALTGLKDFHHWQPMNSLVEHQLLSTEILTVEDYKKFRDFPSEFLEVLEDEGLQEFIHTPLRMADEPYGFLVFDSKKEGTYSEKDFPLFQAIADQLAVAVSNVLANEALIEEKQFKETLLIISEAVASIKDRKELFEVIFERIKPIFNFYDIGLFVLNDSEKKLYDWSVRYGLTLDSEGTEAMTEDAESYAELDVSEGSFLEWVLTTGETGCYVINLSEQAQTFPIFEQTKLILDYGYQDCLISLLKNQGKTIGFLCLNSLEKDFFKKEQFPLFQAIADQLSVAVKNVLASEEVLLQKEKVENLLSISNTISTIASGADLIRLILTDLKRFFPFDDAGLFVYDFAAKKERDLVVDYNFNMGFSKTLYDEGLSGWMPISEASLFTTNKGPHVLTPDELLNKYPHPHFEYLKEHGFKLMIGGPLKNGGEVIGMLCFWSFNENAYSDDSIATFKSISDQVGIALGNVLANEQLIEEKQFKETLLEISEVATQIRDREGLYQVVMQRLKPLVKFDDAVCIVLSEDGTHYTHLLTMASEQRRKHPLFPEIFNKPIPVSDKDPITLVLNQPHLQHNHLDEWIEAYPDYPGFILMRDTGLKDSVILKLKKEGANFGVLFFHFEAPQQLTELHHGLYHSIADQLAVVISNVLASEDLIAEKKKTEDLLAVTESIANITTGPELIRAIFGKLHNVFPFDEIGLFHLDFENNRERDLTVYNQYDLDKENTTHTTNGLMEWMPIRQCTTYLSESLIINGQEIYEQLHHPPFEDPENRIFKQIIAGPLKEGDKTIGMLCFWSKEENAFDGQESLFKSITDQIAVALSNIIANEDIQQREMEKSLQVDIFNALNDSKLWEQKLSGVTRVLQRHIPFNLIVFNFFETKEATGERLPFYSLERLGIEEYRVFDLAHFSKMTGMGENSLKQAFAATDLEPKTFDYKNQRKKVGKNEFLNTIQRVFGANSLLNYPIDLGKERTICISLFSKEANAFKEKQLSLLRSAEQSLVLSLERQLAYDEIQLLNERLQSEKKYLQSEMQATYHFGEIIGESAIMQMVFKQISDVASLDTTVLIQGETGTGKELVARAIHENSPRQDALLVKVNCAAIPRETVESELFGHVKGAFTGAIKDRVGKFELADGGTIFLDEIGELSLDLQAKLLRVLQEKEVEQLGSNRLKKIDFRVIAATNRNLSLEVEKGNFRSDLFYRLHIFPMQLPPLRLRENDVILIAEQIAKQVCTKIGTTFKGFSNASKKVLLSYAWPGNVRELQNLIEQTLIQNRGKIENLRPGFQAVSVDTSLKADSFEDIVNADNLKEITLEDIDLRTQELEKAYLYAILNHTKWRVSGRDGAAALLDVKATTLEYRLKKLGISRSSS